jgi:hypothetical protein
MLRGAISYEAEGKKAILNSDSNGYFVTFFEDDKKLGTIHYNDHSAAYADSAAENWIYGIFKTEEVLKNIEQLEFDFG